MNHLVTLMTAALALGFITPAIAHDLVGQGDFASEVVAEGFGEPTDFAIAPDGRIFVAELRGKVRVVSDGGVVPEPFIALNANKRVERGLLGIALDPQFSINHFVYLFYTPETDPNNLDGPKTNRLIRVTEQNGQVVPDSGVVLLGKVVGTPGSPSCDNFPAGSDCLPQNGLSHAGGALRFAADGSLYVSTGDGLWSGLDVATSLKAQDLDNLAGKLLRINPADGNGYADNPFFDGDVASNRSKVWAYGLRNPYKITIHPQFGLPFLGDVGWDSFEEVNVAPAGANLGWPCLEGLAPVDYYRGSDICTDILSMPPTSPRRSLAVIREDSGPTRREKLTRATITAWASQPSG